MLIQAFRISAFKSAASRALAAAIVAGALLVSACTSGDSPTGDAKLVTSHPLRFTGTPSIQASEGAVVEAIVTYTPSQATAPVTLAHDSTVITADQQTFSISANVADCLNEAASSGRTCTITLTLRLKRDGRVLDESVTQYPITASTQSVQIPALTLFEVSTITIVPTPFSTLEPGDANALTVKLVDKTGVTVTGRPVVWETVSGGVTVSATGQLTAQTTGPAQIRATAGGKSTTLSLDVGQPTVAALAILPADTSIFLGTTAQMRVTATSSTGAVLTGRTLTYTTSAPLTASVSATGLVTGLAQGTTTITVSSTQTRTGTPVTKSTTVVVGPAPAIIVDKANFALADVQFGVVGTPSTVAVTTNAGATLHGLQATITYLPLVSQGWLTATFSPAQTPSTLTLTPTAVSLSPGDYAADVRISSSDQSIPITVHVTLHVTTPFRVVITPKIQDLGFVDALQTTVPGYTVAVGSSTGATLTGLTATVEYLTSVTGWVTASLGSTTSAPLTSLIVIPRPLGLALGAYQARVIVRSTTLGAGPDTLNLTMTVVQPGKFSGLVLNATNGLPISGATISIRRPDNTQVDLITTGTGGTFTSNPLPAGTYSIVITATGFLPITLFNQTLDGGASIPIKAVQTTQAIPVGTGTGVINGSVRDATTNAAVASVTVELRAGANNTTGTPLATTTTNANGTYSFPAQAGGTYTIRSVKTGFAEGSVTVTVAGTTISAPITFLSPGTANVAWRFVLSWGATPLDLDAHLTGPLAATSARFHIYWFSKGNATSSPFSVLDIDQTFGFGPETITIGQQIAGVYRYYVNNFSTSPAISTSNARVDVYQGNTFVNQFFVPQGTGNFWTVFEIDGNTLTPINTIGSVEPSLRLPGGSSSSTFSTPASRAIDEWFTLFPSMPTFKPVSTKRN